MTISVRHRSRLVAVLIALLASAGCDLPSEPPRATTQPPEVLEFRYSNSGRARPP